MLCPQTGRFACRLSCTQSPGGKLLHLTIEDNGPGIAAEHIERIFEPFFTTKQDVGTGLGLWVTKEIIARQGGTIEVTSCSEPGRSGATFLLVLPCAETH